MDPRQHSFETPAFPPHVLGGLGEDGHLSTDVLLHVWAEPVKVAGTWVSRCSCGYVTKRHDYPRDLVDFMLSGCPVSVALGEGERNRRALWDAIRGGD